MRPLCDVDGAASTGSYPARNPAFWRPATPPRRRGCVRSPARESSLATLGLPVHRTSGQRRSVAGVPAIQDAACWRHRPSSMRFAGDVSVTKPGWTTRGRRVHSPGCRAACTAVHKVSWPAAATVTSGSSRRRGRRRCLRGTGTRSSRRPGCGARSSPAGRRGLGQVRLGKLRHAVGLQVRQQR